MQAMLIEYALRTSLIASIVALVLYAMRIKTASVRHAVWSSVVVVMLLLPAWIAWGPKAAVPLLPQSPQHTKLEIPAVQFTGIVPGNQGSTRVDPQSSKWSWEMFFIGIYLLGIFILLARLAIGTLRTIRLTSASCVVPVTVGFFRPRIILPESSGIWPERRLDVVMAHEQEHARRHDPLFQWIALLNRALFWPHPLAWWLERELSGLAEEACDAAVLAKGHDPHDYSETLLDLSRSVELAGSRVNVIGVAMPGAALPHRIRQMLSGVPMPQLSRERIAWTAALCAAAVAMLASGRLVRAQSNPGDGARFEVASVKPANPNAGNLKSKEGGGRGGPGLRPQFDHGKFIYSDTLFGFIVRAYQITGCGPAQNCALLSGGPDWIKNDRFEIQANTPAGTPGYAFPEFVMGEATQLYPMLQSLLVERFKVKVHKETKELPVYLLTVGKSGPKFKQAETPKMLKMPDGTEVQDRSMLWTRSGTGGNIVMIVRDRSFREFTATLSGIMDRPVLDKTGLAGDFDLMAEYEPDPDAADGVPGAAIAGPPFFTALQEQLGLKLESTKATVEVLVIDHAERPTEN